MQNTALKKVIIILDVLRVFLCCNKHMFNLKLSNKYEQKQDNLRSTQIVLSKYFINI